MAIIRMKKLTLLAMQSDKERIFDALARSRNVELKRSAEIDACTTVDATFAREKLAEKIAEIEDGINYVSARAAEFNALHKRDKNIAEVKLPQNSFSRPLAEVSFDYFISFGEKAESIDGDLQLLADLRKRLNADNAEIAQRNAELERIKPLAKLPHATTWYKDTDSAIVQLSQVNVSELARVNELALQYETVTVENVDSTGSSAVVVVVAHKSEADFFKEAASCGLVKCGVVADKLPSVVIEDIERQCEGYKAEIKSLEEQITTMAPKISEWKIYVDYLELSVQKLSAEGDLQQTNATFVMEAYCPVGEEDKVRNAIESVTGNYLLNFD
ncbi:MAG: hypothetical protein NC099_04980, partial [Corallococcus sp.]|nr:hypothetical protein [Corallococcus sp.]